MLGNLLNRTSAARARVVIVGAGFGGLAAAKALARRGLEVTIVDRQNHHLFQPLLYQVATAGLSPAEIAAPIRTIVRRQSAIHVLLAEVSGVDTAAKSVTLASGTRLPYDALVLATGAETSYFGNDGWAVHAPGIKTIDDALKVRSRVLLAMERAETMRQERIETRDDHLTFAVIGGGPTGVEMAGAIIELTRRAARMDFRYLTDRSIRVVLLEGGPRLLPTFPEKLSAAAKSALESLGVEVRLATKVTQIDADGIVTGGTRLPTAVTIWAAGIKATPVADWLGAAADRSGRVEVQPDLGVPGAPSVYVIGDAASATDGSGRSVPGIAPAAKQQGAYVADVIAADLLGSRRPGPFRYRDYGMLATIGRSRAVADFGFLRISGLPAWLLWTTAHIFFLVGFRNRLVVGVNWLWSYLTYDRGARLITGAGRLGEK